MSRILDMIVNRWGMFFFAASTAILGGAYFFQLVLGYQPCELCLLQRYPYMLIIPTAFIAFMVRNREDIGAIRAARGLLVLITVLFFVGTFLAGHHIGVEQGFWEAFTSCSVIEIQSLDDLPDLSVPCDQRQVIKAIGLSFAEINFVLTTLLGGLGVYVFKKTK